MELLDPVSLAKLSLYGLSVGDAFGDTFFGNETEIINRINNRELPDGTWNFTDDTVMGIGVYKILSMHSQVIQDKLAAEFSKNYLLDTYRGYGGTAHSILRNISEGKHWKEASTEVFGGMGSIGNGAAMRSGPIGAFFYNDTERVIKEALLAAEITHNNEEGIAGAVAVSLAACFCAKARVANTQADSKKFFDFITVHLPNSQVKAGILKAATLPRDYDIRTIVSVLGNGSRLTAPDTVPFALWCAAHNLYNFSEAAWTAVSGLGDRDTTTAITGSLVVLLARDNTFPEQWKASTEDFESSPFMSNG